MTDDKFSELVNLYLDQEISNADLALLKAELARDVDRKADFQERCRLDQAMRFALGVARTSAPRPEVEPVADVSGSSSARFPVRLVVAGLAACFTIGLFQIVPVVSYTKEFAGRVLLNSDAHDLLEHEATHTMNRSGLKHFASLRERADRGNASLAAEFRLLGLTPEMVESADAALSEVDLASIQTDDLRQRRIDMLNEIKTFTPMPQPQILRFAEPVPERSVIWPSGFKTSLASF